MDRFLAEFTRAMREFAGAQGGGDRTADTRASFALPSAARDRAAESMPPAPRALTPARV
ncbi:hypothetical protein ABZ412_33130 [Nocardia sp. NPDC005746]|uniref:hypothetical protein n=1 Tax=Nocardia sp. NPDC005746 TaxID=3157062 RepID=UPI0033FC5F6D